MAFCHGHAVFIHYTLYVFLLFPDKDVLNIVSSDEEGSCDKRVLRIPGLPSVDLNTLIAAIQIVQQSFVDVFRFRYEILLSLPSSLIVL